MEIMLIRKNPSRDKKFHPFNAIYIYVSTTQRKQQ
jgi:hypothetical protein